MAERHGGRSGSKDARGGTRRDQEIEKRLENHKRLIDFNKTLNNLYAESADYQRDIQRQNTTQLIVFGGFLLMAVALIYKKK